MYIYILYIFTIMEGTESGRAKSMQTHSPKKWSHVAAQNQRNVSKGAGMPVLF